MDEGNFYGDRNDTNPVTQQSNLNEPLSNLGDWTMADAVPISEEFVGSGYTFETTATQPGNKSSNSISVTQSQNSTSDSDKHTDCKGEESLPKKKVPSEDK